MNDEERLPSTPADEPAPPEASSAPPEASSAPAEFSSAPLASAPDDGAGPPPADAGDEPATAESSPAAPSRSRPPKPRRAKLHKPLPVESDEPPPKMDWYILKVQSNREDSIREALLRKVAIAGMGELFGEIIVPIEKVTEFKNGKKRVVKRKLYPGYIVAHMILNDETWFLVRETSGIGDFTGSGGKPSPMAAHEVERLIKPAEDKAEEGPKLKIAFTTGDRVKITTGTFENFEGEVDAIDEANGRVTVMINIFGRSTPVEIDYWEIEAI